MVRHIAERAIALPASLDALVAPLAAPRKATDLTVQAQGDFTLRRTMVPSIGNALAGYYGLCSFLDESVGRMLAALQAAGLRETTQVHRHPIPATTAIISVSAAGGGNPPYTKRRWGAHCCWLARETRAGRCTGPQ